MAQRVISTKLAVEGESEYRASLTRINGEIKSLQSALKLTESQYQTNANSMAALSAKGDALSALYTAQAAKVKELSAALDNARNAEAAYAAKKQELTAKIEENARALEALKEQSGDTAEEQERLAVENRELNAELEKNEAYLTAAGKGVTGWQDKLNSAKIKLNDLDAELKLNDKYMEEARQSADGCATSIDQFGDRVKESADKADDLREALVAAGVIAALKATADALAACVEKSIEFESALAGVAKTTDMSGAELASMGDAIQDLSTKIPATAVEIANVTEAAGQLGIAKKDLISFSEVMVNLGVATNLSSTEAASALAKFANVVKMSADDYERLGSVIVDLGNNFATTEADIVSMATRLASSGSIVGLTEAEIMAVAAALSSVGIEAEAGGTAISKLLKQFETMVQTGSPQLEDFASVAGMSAQEFSAAWGENAVNALGKFIDGLGAVDDAGGSSVAVLEELGITEVRLSNAVLAMASSNGILQKALNTANNAWTENSALAKEASTRYATTESKLQLLSNAADNVKISVGDKLAPAIGKLAEMGADALNWAADFLDKNDALVPILTAVATAVGVLATGVVAYTAATKLAEVATKMFTAAMNANPIFLAATAIAAVVSGLVVMAATMEDAVPSVKELTTAADEMNSTLEESAKTRQDTVETTLAAATVAEGYIARLKELEAAGNLTDEQAKEYHDTLALLCQVVPELSAYIDLGNDIIIGGTDALEANTEAWKRNAIQRAYQEELIELQEQYADVLVEAQRNAIQLNLAEKDLEAAQARKAEIVERTGELWEEAVRKQNEAYESTGQLCDVTEFLSDEYYRLQDELDGVQTQMFNAQDSIENHQAAIDKDAETVKEAEEQIALTEEAIERLTGAYDENTSAAGDNADAQLKPGESADVVMARINDLAQAYRDAYDAARDSIEGQIGLFDTFAASISEDTDTVEEMMARWSEQTQNLANYTENLKKAADYGLDEGLIRALSDGSTESAGYLATIIGKIEELGGSTENMSTDAADFVDQFNAKFAETSQAKDDFADAVAQMQTDFEDTVAAIEQAAEEADFSGVTQAMERAFANIGIDFKAIGTDAGNGMATGIRATTPAVIDAASDMGQGAADTVREDLDSHSDSRVMIGIGKDFVGGMVTGIKTRQPELNSTVKRMSDGITDSMEESATNTVQRYTTAFSQITTKTNTAIQQLKSTITSGTSSLPNSMYSVGQQVINGMINGMNNRSSVLYSTISSIVNTAIARAKSAAATASPSKKTTKIFEDVGEGMIVGLEHKRQRVTDTAQSVVDEALDLNVGDKIRAAMASIDDRMPVAEIQSVIQPQSAGTQEIHNDFHIEKMEVREEADITKVAQKLYALQRSASRSKGGI